MSELPMQAPKGAEEWRYAELMICLPPTWSVTQEAFQVHEHYWPILWIKRLARLPDVFSLLPLYTEETEFKLEHGGKALMDRLTNHNIAELLDTRRTNVCQKKFLWFGRG